jgi:NADPH:quinone reductase-like Zn-dependent oxidoreductase
MNTTTEPQMNAVRFHEYGSSDVLRYEQAPRPLPGPGEALLRVAATTFNPVDAGIRGGYLRDAIPVSLPHVPGIDVAGTVEAVGAGVRSHRSGDRVIAFLPMDADGAAAEYVVVPADILVAAPSSIPLADAAALPSVGLTAWQSLFEHLALAPGQRLLVNGAGGAVGSLAVQLAKRGGAHVTAIAGPRSVERARRAGADEVIDHTMSDLGASAEHGFDAVLNLAPVAPGQLDAVADQIRPGGALASTVPAAGSIDRDTVRMAAVFVRNDSERLAALVAMIDSGDLQLDVAERVPLSELAGVHARSDAGTLSGRVVVQVA